MLDRYPRGGLKAIALAASAAFAIAVPAQANIEIPDGGAVQRDRTSVITFRVHDGCEGEPTDTVEVAIPDDVENVQPEAVPGWVLEVETVESDGEAVTDFGPGDTITLVRWTGGIVPAGQFADFGLRALFPDLEGEVAFPARQGCGLTESIWDGDADSENVAPSVIVGPEINVREEVQLAEDLETLRIDVAALKDELEGVDPSNVRNRVADLEEKLPDHVDRMSRLSDRIKALEDALAAQSPQASPDGS
jgi:uncharacterized protein YcnI